MQECDLEPEMEASNDAADVSGQGVNMHTPVPLWMFMTSAVLCLSVGVGLGLVMTKRLYRNRLRQTASRSGDLRPLHLEDDDSSDDDTERRIV